jgi:rfaE bifunctional protein nucleotidyltransferase chain/domain
MPSKLESPKIKSLAALRKIVAEAHHEGKKVVLANGCFDLIHVGHIRYLQAARKKGDMLIVAINSDCSVRKLKGPGRPLLPEKERAYILASFWFVDYVTIFPQTTVDHILKKLRPDLHAKGSDYRPETVPEKETARQLGIKVVIVGGPKIRSTSTVIKNLARKFASANSSAASEQPALKQALRKNKNKKENHLHSSREIHKN